MLFEDQNQGQVTQPQSTQTTEDWLAKVVEAKGEQFKDVQVLAKSKLEADNFIKELQTQLADLRQTLGKEEYSKQLLTALENKGRDANANTPVPNGDPKPSDTKPELSEDVIKRLVEDTLTQREKSNTAEQNTKVVREQLESKYGTEAKAHVERKAAELGMTYQRLSELAAESPSAFMTLIGEPKPALKPITQGSINTSSATFQAPAERDWSYYMKLKKENPNLYFNPKTQQQMIQDKMRLGDRFGNT